MCCPWLSGEDHVCHSTWTVSILGDAIWAYQCTCSLSKTNADSADGSKPVGGKQFVYIDGVLVFSQSLDEYLEHLRLVVQLFQDAELKLKPS